MKAWVVIPAYNEGARLNRVVRGVKKFIPSSRLVVVDDGSTVPEKAAGCILLRHDINLGKGSAMKTGADYAFGRGADAVVFIDADGQHLPTDLPKFLKHLKNKQDVVLACRRSTLDAPLVRLLGNKLASIYINIAFGIYVPDLICGYRALTYSAYKQVLWTSTRYGVETEMIARLGKVKHKLKIIQFPIETIYIDKYKGVTIIDAIKVLLNSIWWKLS